MTPVAQNTQARGNKIVGIDRILSMPRASIYDNAGQTIATGTGTLIQWDSMEYDTDDMWRSGFNGLTCRTTGLYAVTCSLTWAANTTGIRQLFLEVNGTTTYPLDVEPASASGTTSNSGSDQIVLNAGDVLQATCAQNSGGNLNLNGGTLSARVNGLKACLISTTP